MTYIKQGAEFQVNTDTTGAQIDSSVAVIRNGNFVVVWANSVNQGVSGLGIYGQVFNGDSIKQGAEFQVNTHITGTQSLPSVTTLSDSNFVIAWESDPGSGLGVYGQVFNGNGIKQGTEFQVNTYTTGNRGAVSITSFNNGNFVATWTNNGQDGNGSGVYGQVFNGNGIKQGTEFQVNTYTVDYQVFPSVAVLSNNNFVVTWQSYGQDGSFDGVYGQVFSDNGIKQGTEFQVNTYTTNAQADSSVAAIGNDNFVVTWQSSGQDGSFGGVYAQIFNSNGVKQGVEFQVNTYTNNFQHYPSIAALSNDNFVVTWQSNFQDGSAYGVFGQVFNSNGVKQGVEFQVNTYTDNNQFYPSIAAFSNSNFVITWTSYGQDGNSYGIYGQIFGFSNTPMPSPTATTTLSSTPIVVLSSTATITSSPAPAPTSTIIYKISGVLNAENTLYLVGKLGDINGDGFKDFVIGTSAESFVILGQRKTNLTDIDVRNLSSIQGFKIFGSITSDGSREISTAGDINKDGYDDIIVGAPNASPLGRTNAGTAYIIFGKETSLLVDVDVSVLSNSQGFSIYGERDADLCGFSVSGVGDVNKDGYDDFAVVAPRGWHDSSSALGIVYVVFGKSTIFSNIDLLSITNTQGFRIYGPADLSYYGLQTVRRAGDVNGDGYADIIIGNCLAEPSFTVAYQGEVTVIYGAETFSDIYLSGRRLAINGMGFELGGGTSYEQIGFSVDGAGDVDGDGYDDIVMGGPLGSSAEYLQSGRAYVIFGKSVGSTFYLSYDLGSRGFAMLGMTNEGIGYSVAGVGDLNKDGYADFTIGSFMANSYEYSKAGECYIIFGKNTGLQSFSFSQFLTTQGVLIGGKATNSSFGYDIKGLGDINGDNYPDILVGAVGAAYLISGEELIKNINIGTTSPSPIVSSQVASVTPSMMSTSSISPSPFSILVISAGGTYVGTSSREDFIVDATSNVLITTGGGDDKITIISRSNMNITVTDFDKIQDVIDLTNFAGIKSLNDFAITSGSAIVNLPNDQKIILQNLVPSDLKTSSFIFTATEPESKDSSLNIGLIVGAVVGGAAFLVVAAVAIYKFYYHHKILDSSITSVAEWPANTFKSNEVIIGNPIYDNKEVELTGVNET